MHTTYTEIDSSLRGIVRNETSVQLLQVATDKCIMLFLFLIVCGVIAIIVVKVSFNFLDLFVISYSFLLALVVLNEELME